MFELVWLAQLIQELACPAHRPHGRGAVRPAGSRKASGRGARNKGENDYA